MRTPSVRESDGICPECSADAMKSSPLIEDGWVIWYVWCQKCDVFQSPLKERKRTLREVMEKKVHS